MQHESVSHVCLVNFKLLGAIGLKTAQIRTLVAQAKSWSARRMQQADSVKRAVATRMWPPQQGIGGPRATTKASAALGSSTLYQMASNN
jgi:hypothetical protein